MENLISRIYLSRSFRRLAGKTQLYSNYNNDHFHNRLTHTLEVKNIAERIRESINFGNNGKAIEAIALAHDLGHTPFGHAGERALNDITFQLDDLSGVIINDLTDKILFKHNYYSAKMLLSISGSETKINNIIAGVINHTNLDYTKHKLTNEEKEKTIRYYTRGYEFNLTNTINNILFDNSVESQIVALADEIAQRVSDFHDLLLSKDYRIDPDEIDRIIPVELISKTVPNYKTSFRIKKLMQLLLDYYLSGVEYNEEHKTIFMSKQQEESMKHLADKRDAIISGSKTIDEFDNNAIRRIKTIFKKLYSNPKLIDPKMVDVIFSRIKNEYKKQLKKCNETPKNLDPMIVGDTNEDKCEFLQKIFDVVHSKNVCFSTEIEKDFLKSINSEFVYGIVFFIANMTDRYAIEKYKDLEKQLN